jgi:ribosylpyrimidine nucleosidase
MMSKRPIILDCDPGHDDAIAIILAGRTEEIGLLGITTSCGNQTLPKTTMNALHITQYLDIDVPICPGSPEPIVRPVRTAPEIHGETGLDGFDFPPLKKQADSRHAVEFLIQTVLDYPEKVTIVVTGPMTNLALALKLEPKIKHNIKEIVFMGGSYGYGNITPAAEFNILVDPEAAHIVIQSGLPITMFGLDATRQVLVLPPIIERMAKIKTKASDLFAQLMLVYNQNQKRVFGLEGGPLHDALTIAYLIDPTIFTVTPMYCEIDISHGPSAGRTNCDILNYQKRPTNVNVATQVDVPRFWNLIETGLRRYNTL